MSNAPVTQLEGLLGGSIDEWVEGLPSYQREHIKLMMTSASPTDVAIEWLSNSGSAETAPFGGVRVGATLFYDKLLVEIQKVICGNEEYENERKEIVSAGNAGKMFIVAAISTAVAPHVGAVAVVIGPAVALILAVVGKAATGAACESLTAMIEARSAQAVPAGTPASNRN